MDSNANVFNTAYECCMFMSVVFIFVGSVIGAGSATVVVGLLLPLSST